MKWTAILSIWLMLFASCNVEEPIDASDVHGGKTVTIRVSMPEDPFTKVGFAAEDNKLKLAWENTDCIRIISGSKSEVYTISKIISAHEAEFEGPAISGSSFNILYPGTYASVEEAVADTATPTQTGNGTTGHLRYKALLTGVDTYSDIAFKSDWAGAHGGTLNQAAAVKLQVSLPGGVSTVKKAGIVINGQNYTLPLSGVDVSASAQTLTAYMMLPWQDIALPDGSKVSIYVMDTDNEAYGTQATISGDKTVQQGKMNSFGSNTPIALTMQDFVAGDGTEANPYLIANARQLNNMHNSSVWTGSSIKYFKLLDNIDASSITNWTPLNTASGFGRSMDFDGCKYTISGLKSSGANYASFAGVLNGRIHDVTFDGATITHTSKIGVVGGFIGTSGVVGSCSNVHVINSTVTGTGSTWAGGFAGEINTTGTIEDCSVENTTVTAKSHVGEFAGIVRGQVATIRNCYTKNFTLAHNTKPAATTGLGGFVGCITINPTFDNCHVEGPVTLSSNVTASGDVKVAVGGFIGYSTPTTTPVFKDCYVEGTTANAVNISGNAEVGGFVANGDRSASYTGCRVTKVSVSGVSHLGGFLGYGQISSGYEVPSIFTDCHVQNVTVTQNLDNAGGSIHTGGFVGYSMQALSYINCSVTGTTVTSTNAQNVGGFVGCTYYAGSNFQSCTVDNATTVTGHASSVGGFVGWTFVPDAYKECSSAATVNNSGDKTGGFVGNATGSAAFTNCSVSGNVTNNSAYTGGFAGYAENASFLSCHYDNGTVNNTRSNKNVQVGGFVGSAATATSFIDCYVSNAIVSASSAGRTGGFAGQLGLNSAGGNEVSATHCYVTGTNVDGAQNTGGFVGVQYEKTTQCYVEGGTVTAHNSQVGGFSAFIQNCDVTHCYTTATVAGGSYNDVGGFAGHLYQGSIQNCFSSGTQNGNGANRAAFVAQCKNATGTISNCIGWHETLPFCGNNDVSAVITNGYEGTSGTVSSRAASQSGWTTDIWNLDGAQPVLKPGSARIPAVFMGDSITWQWARTSRKDSKQTIIDATHGALGNDPLPSYMTLNGSNITTYFHPGFFSGNGYIDKGISGQNTTQMRARFEKDVVALNPKVFVIMAGTNDIAQGVSNDDIFNNIAYMASEAKTHGMKVIICSITPNNRNYTGVGWKSQYIEALNERFQNLCTSEGYAYCDYWSSLVARTGEAAVSTDIDHGLKDAYKLYDDLHPGPAAYTVMEGIVKPIIDGLL